MQHGGEARPTGALALKVVRGDGRVEEYGAEGMIPGSHWPNTLRLAEILQHSVPHKHLPFIVNEWRRRNRQNLNRRLRKVLAAKALRIPMVYGALYIDVYRGDGSHEPYGLASLGVVTDTGVGYIVDALQNITEAENMKFHGFGTGSTAEAASQTALVTELTTEYATDNVRPTGSQTENGSNVYRTVATLDPDADVALREHGIFSQAATGGGVLLDRSLFAAINLSGAGGDTLATTYDFTVTSGG